MIAQSCLYHYRYAKVTLLQKKQRLLEAQLNYFRLISCNPKE